MRAVFGIVAMGLGLATHAAAEPLTGKVALAQLFPPKGAQVEMMSIPGLSSENMALLEQIAGGYAYYAAVALAPDEDLMTSEATSLAGNHHSTKAAAAAALAACDKLRKGGRKCVVAALVRPPKWENRVLQLSVEATVALKNDYGRRGPRAFAVSPSTGAWALGSGNEPEAAALAGCKSKGADDCQVVVADPA